MAKRKRKTKSADELGTENELMKLKMMAEFGGNFVANEEIPPEVENVFLKQIMQFHKLHDPANKTTIYKFIGSPEYNAVTDLSNKQLEKELSYLLKLMGKNGVAVSCLADLPNRELYRFITEELFKLEIDDVKMKGWTTQFVYEEFHPNPLNDIKGVTQGALQSIFNTDVPVMDDMYAETIKSKIGLSTDTDELREQIQQFHSQFNDIRLHEIKIPHITTDDEAGTANAVYEVSYQVQSEKGKRFKTLHTIVEFNLTRHHEMKTWWSIEQIICDLL